MNSNRKHAKALSAALLVAVSMQAAIAAEPHQTASGSPDASLQAMPPQALPPLPEEVPVAAPKPDFDTVLSNTLGLTPSQIKTLRQEANARQRAASQLPETPPKPVTTMVSASTSPGSTAPVVRLFPGFATSMIVTDSTGQPWPIENFTVGHANMFDVKRLDAGNGSALSIVPLGYYAQSNMILYLKGLPTPIAVSFVSGQKEVDFRVDLRVQGRGPNADIAAAGLPSSTNPLLLSVLVGDVPSDAKKLKVSAQDDDLKAWMGHDGKMLVRSKLQVISPAWLGSVRSADGTSAYEMLPASRILVMRDGKIDQISVEGW